MARSGRGHMPTCLLIQGDCPGLALVGSHPFFELGEIMKTDIIVFRVNEHKDQLGLAKLRESLQGQLADAGVPGAKFIIVGPEVAGISVLGAE